MSEAIAGYVGVAYISTNGTDFDPIIELKDVTIKRTTKMLDATSHSSGGEEDYIPGVRGWTATANSLTVFSDASNEAKENGYNGRTRFKFRFDPAGTDTGKPRFEGYGYIEDLENKFPNLDLVEDTISIRGSGVLAYSTQ